MSFINSPDLTKMLLNQISACSAILGVPGGPVVMGHLIIMGLLYFLLELELLKAVKGNLTGAIFVVTTTVLGLDSKACTHNFLGPKRSINAGILGSTFIPPWLWMADTSISMPFLSRRLSA